MTKRSVKIMAINKESLKDVKWKDIESIIKGNIQILESYKNSFNKITKKQNEIYSLLSDDMLLSDARKLSLSIINWSRTLFQDSKSLEIDCSSEDNSSNLAL